MDYDILISGAGPAGLCLAGSLSGHGLRVGVVEQQPLAAIENPAYDGREIALTQQSAQMLRDLGLWDRIVADEPSAFSPLRDAQVLNGPSPFAMVIDHQLSQHSELGWLVSNHLIRRAAFQELRAAQHKNQDITLLAGEQVARAHTDASAAHVTLASGKQLRARLLVAADSRFSATRRALGIGADMHDFGRSMLLCTMAHALPHQHVAWEWFGYGQTLALLPMNDDPATGAHRSCVVLTLPHHTLEALQDMDETAFGLELTRRFDQRLGAMQLVSTRHLYPLVGVRPHRLVAPRFACVGDAAVGMHPVTAHGFNFGLRGITTLAGELRAAHAAGQDIAAPELLARYERAHRRATLPLYLATTFIARLYTTDHPPARLLRDAALRLAQNFPPFKRMVAATLSGRH
ncbi:MAG TPA: 5-demethoxyubiquinol-8 5-hydroxylase UbiM [Giesbergeria sp.]|nr:5-demethoxyubiquinol-8 5-hydroxylase UbiM [Giesbergeria sp.]HRA13430.1 5-demethoxyubiquinol-8 5-hydroxylase UbiM [Giesbergeria sp.]